MRKLFSIIAATLFATTMFAAVQEFSVTIPTSAFNSTSYAANNNEKTSTAVATADASVTMDVKWTSNQVMLNSSKIQGQKNTGLIYNAASWGKVKSVTINDNANFTYVIGAEAKPSTTAEGGFFQIKAGSSTSTCTSIVIVFEADPAQASLIAADYDLGEVLCEPEGIFAEDITVKVEGANLTDEISFTTMSEKLSFVTTGNLPATGGNLVIRVTGEAGDELNEGVVLTSGTMITSFNVKGKVFEKYYTPGTTRVSFDAGEKAQGGDTTFVNGQKAVKVGTSSAAGTAIIHVPAGATKLYFLAAAWSGKPCKIALSADGITMDPSADIQLTADAGIANNSPFYTKKGDLSVYQVEVALSGVTALTDVTVTATSSDKRFVLWDVTCDGDTPTPPTPTPGDTVTVAFVTQDGLEWQDYTSDPDELWWDIFLDDVFELSNSNDATHAHGTYDVSILDANYCYVYVDDVKVGFKEGSVTVAVSADSVVTVNGFLTGTDDVVYAFDITYNPALVQYKYDEDDNFAATFESYEINDSEFEENHVILISATQDDQGAMIGMFLPATATEAVPVAGTYPINGTYQPQTVAAGYYDDSEGLIPSIAAVFDDSGYASNVWYLISGTVTVNENKTLTVVAKNSRGHNIALTLKGEDEPTSIANTKAANLKRKTIKNGHLYINDNNVEYNVNGAIVK